MYATYATLENQYSEEVVDYVLCNIEDYAYSEEPDYVSILDCEEAIRLEKEAGCMPIPDALTPAAYAEIWNRAVWLRRFPQ